MKNSTSLADGIGQAVVIPVMNTILSAIGEIAKFSLVVLFTFCIAHLLLANVYDVEGESPDMISMASFERSAEVITMEQVNSPEGKKSITLVTPKESQGSPRRDRTILNNGEDYFPLDHSNASGEILTQSEESKNAQTNEIKRSNENIKTVESTNSTEESTHTITKPITTSSSKQDLKESDTENPKTT